METVRVLFFIVCLVAFDRAGVSGSNFIGYGTGRREVATSRNAPRNDGAKMVISAARKEVGVREVSENAGERVDEYCAYVGVKKVAWCAAFVSWCFGQAGYTQPKTAWSPALFPDARSGKVPKGRLRREPVPGMVMGIYFPSMGRIAHCGIVESVRGDFIVCIEGNTSISGNREGDGVYRRMRHKRSIAKYADWL